MPPDAPTQEPSFFLDLGAWVAHHPLAAICVGAIWLWISISLIIRMWLVHRRVSLYKRLFWSLTLFIPLFGWIAYGGCFHAPGSNDTPCPVNSDAERSGGGGYDAGGHH